MFRWIPVVLCLWGCAASTTRPSVRDADGDGIPDHTDKCPAEAEDFDGDRDGDGCPDPDSSDHVHIPDVEDKCWLIRDCDPGFMDDDGCPDFVISFVRSSSELEKAARGQLAELANELLGRRKVATLRIEAHAAPGENPSLALSRAATVRRILVERGVPASMLTSKTGHSVADKSGYVSFVAERCREASK